MCVHAQQHFFQLSSLFVFSVCEFVYLFLCLFFVCLCVLRSKDQNHKPYMYIRDINSNATRTEQTVSLVCVTRIPTSLTPPQPQSQCLKALTCRPASHAAHAIHAGSQQNCRYTARLRLPLVLYAWRTAAHDTAHCKRQGSKKAQHFNKLELGPTLQQTRTNNRPRVPKTHLIPTQSFHVDSSSTDCHAMQLSELLGSA